MCSGSSRRLLRLWRAMSSPSEPRSWLSPPLPRSTLATLPSHTTRIPQKYGSSNCYSDASCPIELVLCPEGLGREAVEAPEGQGGSHRDPTQGVDGQAEVGLEVGEMSLISMDSGRDSPTFILVLNLYRVKFK